MVEASGEACHELVTRVQAVTRVNAEQASKRTKADPVLDRGRLMLGK